MPHAQSLQEHIAVTWQASSSCCHDHMPSEAVSYHSFPGLSKRVSGIGLPTTPPFTPALTPTVSLQVQFCSATHEALWQHEGQ